MEGFVTPTTIAIAIGVLIIAVGLVFFFVFNNKKRKPKVKTVHMKEYYSVVKEEYGVKLVSKNTEIISKRTGRVYFYAIFELENKDLVELQIVHMSDFEALVEGAVGTLRFNNDRFISFQSND